MAERIYVPAEERLLDVLVEQGRIRGATREHVLRQVVSEDVAAVEILRREGVCDEESVAQAVSTARALPLLDPRSFPFEESALGLVDQKTAAHLRVIPLRLDGPTLVVAMENPLDEEAIRSLEFQTGRSVRPAVAPRSAIRRAISEIYQVEGSLRNLVKDLPDDGFSIVTEEGEADEGLDGEGAPVVKVVNRILLEAISRGASDVHIEPGANLVHVRYRVHGVLEDALELPRWIQSSIIARIKVMAGLDITERRTPQDGRVRVRQGDRTVDVRVSSLPVQHGEKIVLRILDADTCLRSLEDLGFAPKELEALRRAVQRPEGMILVTGPTGSGKTTTLYAILQEIASREQNVVTIENPVEYEIAGINQVGIDDRQGRTFAKTLRSILRQDPDVILVGEIRDAETAEVAFHAAQTGHLVLSTVHTNDTAATITRLLGLGVDRTVLASSLLMVVAQRLVRTRCPKCAGAGASCRNCRGTGHAGRTGVYEILSISDTVRSLLESGASELQIRAAARKGGMKTLGENALEKVASGLTTREEVERSIDIDPTDVPCPECGAAIDADAVVCPGCRAALRTVCSGCEQVQDEAWASCPFCGLSRDGAPRTNGHSSSAVLVPPKAEIDRPRVLVVDDNADLRKIVRLALEKSPLAPEVAEASDGETALRQAAELSPHAILLDIMMPGIDGYEVCRRLRSDLETALIPILMLTAKVDKDSRIEGFLAGTDDYIPKPFDREELLVRFHRLLERTYGLSAS